MKALQKKSRQPGDIALVDLPVPVAFDNKVIAKVAYAGICGSDVDILYSRNTIYVPPVVQGHEFSAIITQVGDDVKELNEGDKIVSETTFECCTKCQMCRDGNYHLCLHKQIVGWTENGGFAEYVLLNSNYLHKLDATTDLQQAALIEPSAIACEGVLVKGRLQPGDTIAVIGPGTIGVLCALVAKAAGAGNVFLLGLNDAAKTRFKIANEMGLQHCIDVSATNALDYILEHNENKKPDMVVDCTGNINGFLLALDLIKRNGRIIEAGSIHGETSFPWEKAAYNAIDLLFVFSSSHTAWEYATAIFNNSGIDFSKMITATFGLEDYEKAFSIATDTAKSLKIMFNPS